MDDGRVIPGGRALVAGPRDKRLRRWSARVTVLAACIIGLLACVHVTTQAHFAVISLVLLIGVATVEGVRLQTRIDRHYRLRLCVIICTGIGAVVWAGLGAFGGGALVSTAVLLAAAVSPDRGGDREHNGLLAWASLALFLALVGPVLLPMLIPDPSGIVPGMLPLITCALVWTPNPEDQARCLGLGQQIALWGLLTLFYAVVPVHRSSNGPAEVVRDLGFCLLFAGLVFTLIFDRRQQAAAILSISAVAVRRTPRLRGRMSSSGLAPSPIVLLAYHYPPHNEIGAARPRRFARYLRRRGIDVQVICSDEALRREEDKQILAPLESPAPCRISAASGPPGVRWVSYAMHAAEQLLLPYADKLGWLPCAYREATRAMSPRAVIISTHPPIATHMTALLLKLRFNRPWIADFRDPLWGNPTRTALRSSLLDPLIEQMIMSTADAVIANTDSAGALLRGRYPALADKVHVIWNGFDPDDAILPIPERAGTCKRISHVGSLYGARSPLPMLGALDRLVARGTLAVGWQFRQIGRVEPGTPIHAELRALAEAGRIHLSARHLPQRAARAEMLESDILLLLDMNQTNPGLQVPAKLFEYARTGRPILALTQPRSATAMILAIAGVPHLCLDMDMPQESFDAEILTFLNTPHVQTFPSARFLSEFSAEGQVETLMGILNAISHPFNDMVTPNAVASVSRREYIPCAD